jgi:hypothetical protein
METFIIRIYHRLIDKPENIVGITEHVETGEKQAFKDLQKLNEIIINPKSEQKKYKKSNPPSRTGIA